MKNFKQSANGQFDFDLVFIGSGSAAFAGAIKAIELGKRVAIIEHNIVGGTCVNIGCVPSKNLIRAAETKYRGEHSNFNGIRFSHRPEVDFSQLIHDKDELVSSLRHSKYQSIIDREEKLKFVEGKAQFIDENSLDIDGKRITAKNIVISTGSSPTSPAIDGLKDADFLTSKMALELEELPKRLAVLGGGYIALECAQLFARLGAKVTVIQRSEILRKEDSDVQAWIKKYLRQDGIDILEHTIIDKVSSGANAKTLRLTQPKNNYSLDVDQILVATGRAANTSDLNLDAVGIIVAESGAIHVNEFGQTSQPNIYAAGDVTDSPAFVYVAAYEGNLAAENAILGNRRKSDFSIVPWVIFSDPQVSGVGLNEKQAKEAGIDFDKTFLTFDNVPRAIAAQNTRGFIKLLRRKGNDELIGARIVAPEGSELIMQLCLILKYKIPLSEVGTMMYPYLTQSEAVKLAIQAFDKDVGKLSCCAA